ncbi:MAG: sulfite exporter TauE/SafE family protein [bacterium]
MIDLKVSLIGFLIGFLIGLTGMGGGALMAPILIFFLKVPALFAIGTDLVYSSITKIFGAWQHYKQGTVDLKVTFYLASGSIPASLLGVRTIRLMQENGALNVDLFVMRALGIALVLVAVILFIRVFNGHEVASIESKNEHIPRVRRKGVTVLLGAVVGFLVGLTSVGSGTIIIAVLVFIYPYLTASKIVGTDIFHAALLVSVAGLAHLYSGNVNLPVVGSLLIGSIPGVLAASRLTLRIPNRILRGILAVVLLSAGLKLI